MGNQRRTSRNTDTARLVVAAGLSLTLHTLLAALWVVTPPGLQSPNNPKKVPPVVRFGIDQSQHQTIAWLGFIDPTPHQAPLSITDQSALSPEVSAAEPSESAPSAGTGVAIRIVEAGSAAGVSVGRWIAQGQLVIARLLDSAADAAKDQQPGQAEPKEPPNTEEQAETADSADPANPAGAGSDAIESPKESDAVSRDAVLEYRHGKVASRQGLDIKTVKPRWVDAILLTADPRNSRVRIEFGSDGKVKKAAFEGIGTGYETVDHILLNAIYAWTATGKEIDDLKETDPDGVVIARVRIRLK